MYVCDNQTSFRRLLTDDVFEYQIPSDNERDEFAHADVTVNVGRPSFWHPCRKFGVTQAWKHIYKVINIIFKQELRRDTAFLVIKAETLKIDCR